MLHLFFSLAYNVFTKRGVYLKTYPELSEVDLQKLRTVLCECGVCSSYVKAKKLTSNRKAVYDSFCKYKKLFNGDQVALLSDVFCIYDLYIASLISDLDDKTSIQNDTTEERRSRGKGKKPNKVSFMLRLEPLQLQRLKDLGGDMSKHIRSAIDAYLLSKDG